ncbi:hypothetical protein Taro_055089 [Colocasia esculenta]|uniref:ATP synthase protein MI25 n=1 Tax=Colocasia esculenta TaxID=4460 RepID=A0A843XSJ1_COLES|nr:hypothetical protein [Colocasia esculenta]
MKLSSTDIKDRKMLFAAILSIGASIGRSFLQNPMNNNDYLGSALESLPTARCTPKCEKTVQALLCRNLNVKSTTLLNATSSRRIRLQDDIVTGFHFSVSERFVPGCTLKASIVELIREGLVVLRRVQVGGSLF